MTKTVEKAHSIRLSSQKLVSTGPAKTEKTNSNFKDFHEATNFLVRM